MKLEDISSEWQKDSKIDEIDLDKESLKIPSLHHKYYTVLTSERLLLRKYELDLKVLKKDKFEFYTQGHNEETRKKGWELPPRGTVNKSEASMYIESDRQLEELSLKIILQQEKVDLLTDIIKTLSYRGYNIKTAVEYIKFKNGV
jgi:hypothetical protein